MSKKRWTVKSVLKEVVTTAVIFFFISIAINYIRKPEVTEDIYSYSLVDIKNEKINFSKYKGEPLVVNFWATWCPTCKLEASNIDTVSKSYNVVTIAVNSGSNEALLNFINEHELNYSVINDGQGTLATKFNITAYPTTLIYDKEGLLKFTEVGYSTTLGLKARLTLLN